MQSLSVIFNSISCLLAILAAAILFWLNHENSHSKRMLIWLLLLLALLNLNGVIFHNGWYMQLPWLHKIATPFSLLIMPVTWLYVRSVLKGEIKARKTDWLLVLPAILFAINLIPYYAMPTEEKKAYLAEYYNKKSLWPSESEGMLPAYIISYIRVFWSLLFIILNYRLIRQFRKMAPEKVLQDNEILLKWLTLLNWLLAGLLAATLFVAISASMIGSGLNVFAISLGIFVLIICIQLFIRPKILYGVYLPSLTVPDHIKDTFTTIPDFSGILTDKEDSEARFTEDIASSVSISSLDASRYKLKLENFFRDQKPYLQTEYSLEHLVTDIHVPRYILSTFINREYGMGFREYLNRQRVEYLINNLDKPEWKNFTLEAIATECGFNSRITFSKNFKQITGQTPTDYIKSHQSKISDKS
jgi:AraC-like DNA-binding protein